MSSKKLIAWLENFITMGGRSDSGQENLDYFANSNRYQIGFMTQMFTLKIILRYQMKKSKKLNSRNYNSNCLIKASKYLTKYRIKSTSI